MKVEPIADAAARDKALNPGSSFIVEAPAGSGKTTLLTQRFLRLLSIVEQPESIVAITFTRKAAEEMRGRVLSALRAVRQGPDAVDPVTRRWAEAALMASDDKGWRLLDSPKRLRVQTIDSLSATIARRGPLVSGYTGNVEVLEDASRFYRQAAHRAIAELGEDGLWSDAVRCLLRYLDNDWERLENLLTDMLSRRDQWLRFITRHPDRETFERALGRAVGDELKRVTDLLPARFYPDIVRLCAFAGANLLVDYPDDIGGRLARLDTMPGCDCGDLSNWQAIARLFLTGNGSVRRRLSKREGFPAQGPGAAEHKELFAALVTDMADLTGFFAALGGLPNVPEPRYSDEEWRSIEALFAVLKLVAAELKVAFSAGGGVDFIEVAHAALAALGGAQNPTDLGLILDYQIQHLLIDEFQDTSITQFELIERLVDGWVGGDGRSLFLVGDPMQSIYRFRQAEVSLFIDTCAAGRLAAVPLEALQLKTNFRAQAALVDWVNGAVGDMRTDPIRPFSHMPRLVAARPTTDPTPVHIDRFIAENDEAETAAVVSIVKRTRANHPDHKIGVLVRGRRHLGSISSALLEAAIPVSASEIDRLSDQTIVQDLVALTRALLHPADRTAWLAILRAPWCGLSLASLSVLFEGEANSTIWQRLGDYAGIAEITESERHLIANFRQIISVALTAAGREPIASLVERTWLALGGPDAYPVLKLTQAERYLELLSACEKSETLITANRLRELLDRQYVAPSQHAESAVEIMTVHRAKGLEFDVVILPGLGRTPRSDPHRLLAWRQHIGPAGPDLLFAPIPAVGAPGGGIHAYLHGLEKRELDNEAYRLLYVALTRAREALYLLGSVKEHAEGGPAPAATGSFLRMLWTAIGEGVDFSKKAGSISPSTASVNGEHRQWIRRLRAPPGPASTDGPEVSSIAAVQPRADIEFSWATPIAKHVGTVTHGILQRICTDGLRRWSSARVRELTPYIERRLRGFGVGAAGIVDARERIIAAVIGAMESDRGRWIMDDQYESAHSEYALTSVIGGKAANVIIDRTFIDAEGTRWIVDFKTGAHTGGDKAMFIASEVERYRPQLEGYARLMQVREDRPIALGLFFPLLDAWSEWSYSAGPPEQSTAAKPRPPASKD